MVHTTQYQSNAGRLFNAPQDALRDDFKAELAEILSVEFSLGKLSPSEVYDAIADKCDAVQLAIEKYKELL